MPKPDRSAILRPQIISGLPFNRGERAERSLLLGRQAPTRQQLAHAGIKILLNLGPIGEREIRNVALIVQLQRSVRRKPRQFRMREARAVTDLPKDTDDAVWSPDGKRIAFTSTSLAKDFAKDLKQDEKSDVRVINHIEYRNNSGGYVDFERPAHIWVADVPAFVDGTVKPRPINPST